MRILHGQSGRNRVAPCFRNGRKLRRVRGWFQSRSHSLACGLAVYTGCPVITPDVLNEPLWAPWLWLAKEYDFCGCWSFPVETVERRVVGTLALYFPTPRQASPQALASQTIGMAIHELATNASKYGALFKHARRSISGGACPGAALTAVSRWFGRRWVDRLPRLQPIRDLAPTF